jgi:hypothetical protein
MTAGAASKDGVRDAAERLSDGEEKDGDTGEGSPMDGVGPVPFGT